MTKPKTAQPDTRRRRASTGAMMDRIMGLARRLPLTRQVLAEQLETATPAQMEFMHAWMNAELESRERSKRARLLKQAGFPQSKELDGYDWTPLRFPVDYGRQALESLDFIDNNEDVVMFGPPGTGKTHLAIALGRQACRQGIPARFFTAAELVMRLLRASTEGRLDRELAQIGRARLLVIDELGYVPIDEEGSRLLFQVVTNAYERQSVIHDRQHRVRRMGQDLRRPQHGRRDHRPHRPPRQDDQIRGRVLPQDPRPHAITNKHNQTGRDQTLKRQQTSRSPGKLSHAQTARPNLTQHKKRPGRRPAAPVEPGEDDAGRPAEAEVFAEVDGLLAAVSRPAATTATTRERGSMSTGPCAAASRTCSANRGAGTGIGGSGRRWAPGRRRR